MLCLLQGCPAGALTLEAPGDGTLEWVGDIPSLFGEAAVLPDSKWDVWGQVERVRAQALVTCLGHMFDAPCPAQARAQVSVLEFRPA